jgi:hypothetical protein
MKTYDDFTQEERHAMSKEDRTKLLALIAEKNLRGLVEAATPGPWYRSHGCISAPGLKFLFDVERCASKGLHGTEADARFISASNPKKVGELLDLICALLEERDAAIDALTDTLRRVKEIAEDFIPSRADDAQGALDEMREELLALVPDTNDHSGGRL